MATTKLKGDLTINLLGEMPQVGVKAPDFTAVKASLAEAKLEEYRGKKVVLNIFPSIDTGFVPQVCVASTRLHRRWQTLPFYVYPRIFHLLKLASVEQRGLKM